MKKLIIGITLLANMTSFAQASLGTFLDESFCPTLKNTSSVDINTYKYDTLSIHTKMMEIESKSEPGYTLTRYTDSVIAIKNAANVMGHAKDNSCVIHQSQLFPGVVLFEDLSCMLKTLNYSNTLRESVYYDTVKTLDEQDQLISGIDFCQTGKPLFPIFTTLSTQEMQRPDTDNDKEVISFLKEKLKLK